MRLVVQWFPLLLSSWAGRVGAATDCAPSSGSFSINSADDVTTLNQCTTFTGNVSVVGKGIQDITLNGIKGVTGTLQIADIEGLLSISSTTLSSLPALILSDLPKLTTLTLPALTNFSKLDFTGLTALTGCEIATGTLMGDVNEINILNTALESIAWLKWPVATSMTIAANKNLTNFSVPYDRINAGSTYQISINSKLSGLDFSQLTGIYGSLTVNGNNDSQLHFDKLETIDGYVRLDGALTNITMPALAGINGALRADSTVDILSFCNWLSVRDHLSGHYDCTANDTSPVSSYTASKPLAASGTSTAGAESTDASGDTNDDSSTSDLSTGAIVGIAVAMVILISTSLTASALFLFRRRSRNKALAAVGPNNRKRRSTSTLGEGPDASGTTFELEGKKTVHEVHGAGPVGELDGKTLQELDCENPFFRDQKPAPASPIGRFELP